jgi:hypothetical protein
MANLTAAGGIVLFRGGGVSYFDDDPSGLI